MTTVQAQKERSEDKSGKALLVFIVFAVAAFWGYKLEQDVYANLDKDGWISHQADRPVVFNSSWVIGEYKPCYTYPPSSPYPVDCDISVPAGTYQPHEMSILFHGRIDRADRDAFMWRCQRRQTSLECWAVN